MANTIVLALEGTKSENEILNYFEVTFIYIYTIECILKVTLI